MNNILEGIPVYKGRIERRREELEYLEAVKKHITPQTYNRVKRNAEKAIAKSEQEYNKILEVLNGIPHELKRKIIIMRYVNGLSLIQVADTLAYSETHINHLHAEAMKELNCISRYDPTKNTAADPEG